MSTPFRVVPCESCIAPSYRPDLDGLRAVAVAIVVLYHAGLGFPGGYIGVDIFFVISGYLITQKLKEDFDSGHASVANFYSRRAKRILPALVAVYVASLVVGALVMLPIDFKELGRSVLSSALFVSNLYFYSLTGYFDGPAHEKPMLHTWSLSVEEQFYLLWPLLCFYLLFKLSKDRRLAIIAVMAVASLVAAQYFQYENRDAAFYWPISRAWELLAGAVIALNPLRVRAALSNIVSLASLLAIAACGVLLDSRSLVPGFAALPAIAGTAMLIAAGPSTVGARLLSGSVPVRIGLISYSLYLWHWPLLALGKYQFERDLSKIEASIFVLASFVLAWLSWRYIEQPARKSTLSTRAVLASSAAVVLLFAVAGLLVSRNAQIDQSAPAAQLAMRDAGVFNPLVEKCHRQQSGNINRSAECRIGAVKDAVDFLLIGDSHADHFSPAFDAAGKTSGFSGKQITHGGCLPIWGIRQTSAGNVIDECEEYRSQVLSYIKQQPSGRTIVMAARWIFYSQTTGPNVEVPYFVVDGDTSSVSVIDTRRAMLAGLRETLKMFAGLGHRIVLVSQVPEYPFFKLSCFVRYAGQKDAGAVCGDYQSVLSDLMRPADAILLEASKGIKEALVVHPADLLCQSGRCVVEINGVFLYRDLHHLNFRGSRQFSTIFADALRRSSGIH